jgi:hypothetical protein
LSFSGLKSNITEPILCFSSSGTGRFVSVCYHCGASEDLIENEEIKSLQREFAVVRPICQSCIDLGLQPNTRFQI